VWDTEIRGAEHVPASGPVVVVAHHVRVMGGLLVVGRDKVDSAVTSFLEAADGVVTVDSSELTIDETVDVVLSLVESRR